MGTWAKENAVIGLYSSSTGLEDTSSHTVKYQPIDQDYDTGAIAASQLGSTNRWMPDSDLDDEQHYDIYVDGTKKFRMNSPESVPMIGG